jgi:hypothetical protein
MTATLLWALLGVVFVGLIAAVIVRLDAAALGPYSTRLVAVAAALAAYFGAWSLARHVPALSHPVRLRLMAWGVPLSAALALLYCLWRVLQNWQSELHGLMRGLFKLALVLLLAVLARLCFTL